MVTAQVAVSMALLMALLSLLADGGLMLVERRHAQATADATALAAAADLFAKWNTNGGSDPNHTAYNSAMGVAFANGYTNDGTTSAVTVNISPARYSGGPNAGGVLQAGYAEAVVTWYQPRGFSVLFGSGDIPITARAVARGTFGASTPSVLLLSPSAAGALSITGNAVSPGINVSGAIDVNSTAPRSMDLTGNIELTAAEYNLAAAQPGYSRTANVTMKGTVNNNQSPAADPLSYITPPDPSGLTTQSSSALKLSGDQTVTLQPGVYVGGISINGNFTGTLQPGIYYMQGGGFSASGNVNLTGAGVMIYNAPSNPSDAISFNGNTVLNLSPMTSGPYTGLTIFQDRASTAPISLVGNSGSSLTGTIYAAGAAATVIGNANTQIGSQFITSTLDITGNTAFTVGGSGALVAPARQVGLVE